MSAFAAPLPSRSPWQLLYGWAHRGRVAYWRRRATQLPVPVVSVGNLHWGGSGKTPLVSAIAAHLRDRGRRVAVLSRGYRRQDSALRIASTGAGPLLGPRVVGDEPALLAAQLPGVAVVVGADRAAAGAHALLTLEPPPDLLLLDDGFSHLRLRRDLDILALPAADPWAGGRLAPSGRLREPLTATRRAQAVVLTGATEVAPRGEELAAALRPYGFAGSGFVSRTVALPARYGDRSPVAAGERVLALCAIGRPEAFFELVDGQGFEVAERLSFPDHHPYSDHEVANLDRRAAAAGAAVLLSTEKDTVKLYGRLRTPLAEIPIRAEPEPAFWAWLDSQLPSVGGGDR